MLRHFLFGLLVLIVLGLPAVSAAATGCGDDDDDNNDAASDDDNSGDDAGDDATDDDAIDDDTPSPDDDNLDDDTSPPDDDTTPSNEPVITRLFGGELADYGMDAGTLADGRPVVAASRGGDIVLYWLSAKNDWEQQVLTSGARYMDMAVDASGVVHILFSSARERSLRHGVWVNGTYAEETALIDRPYYYDRISLAVDDNGAVHALIEAIADAGWPEDYSAEVMLFLTNADGAWEVAELDFLDAIYDSLWDIRIAAGVDGVTHLIYPYSDNTQPTDCARLMYGRLDGGAWSTEMVADCLYTEDPPGWRVLDSPWPGDLAAGPDGVPHFQYTNYHAEGPIGSSLAYTFTTTHAWREDDGWKTEVIGDTEGHDSSLVVDDQGYVHLANDTDPYEEEPFQYGDNVGGTWSFEPAARPDSGTPELALSGTGEPYIFFSEQSRLYGSWRQAKAWERVMLDSSMEVPGPTSAAAGPDGALNVAFSADNMLYYGTNQDGDWRFDKVAGFTYYSANLKLVLDADLRPNIVSVEEDPLVVLRLSTLTDNGWRTRLISYGVSSTDFDVAADAQGSIQVAAVDNLQLLRLVWLRGNGSDWERETINNAITYWPSIATDQAGAAHICFNTLDDLYYATNASGNWELRSLNEVLAISDAAHCTVFMDQSDRPNFGMFADWHGSYVLAVPDNDSWQTVSTPFSCHSFDDFPEIHLGLDEAGELHVSYFGYWEEAESAPGVQLRHFKRYGEDWESILIEPPNYHAQCGGGNSMALGPSDAIDFFYGGFFCGGALWRAALPIE